MTSGVITHAPISTEGQDASSQDKSCRFEKAWNGLTATEKTRLESFTGRKEEAHSLYMLLRTEREQMAFLYYLVTERLVAVTHLCVSSTIRSSIKRNGWCTKLKELEKSKGLA